MAEQLKKRFAGNKYVVWYMEPLLDSGADIDTEDEWIEIIEKFLPFTPKEMNLNYSRMLPKVDYCMVQRSSSFGIDVNGDIKICGTHFTHSSKSISNIQNFDGRRDKRRKYPEVLPKCQNCPWLPICGGGCITRHIHNALPCSPKKTV